MKQRFILVLLIVITMTLSVGCSSPADDNSDYSSYTSPSDILEIQEGWAWTRDGNYTYVKGRIKNISEYPVEYWEVTAEYLDDKGNVLDSDYTNGGQTLNPNDMKEFEIMHERSDEYVRVKIYVNRAD